MKYHFGLILVSVISFCIIQSFDFPYDPNHNHDYSLLKLLAPGLLFSLYFTALRFNELPMKRSLMHVAFLILGYAVAILISLETWGMAAPFAGSAGALLVNYTITGKFRDENLSVLTLTGFCCGLVGIIIYYLTAKFLNDGTGFGIIILIWQLVIGFAFIQRLRTKTQYS